MTRSKKPWGRRSIFTLCVISLVFNIIMVSSYVRQENQVKYAEAHSMEHAAAEMNQANQFLQTNKTFAVAMLAEVAGALMSLQAMPLSSSTKAHLDNVAYYLHSQASVASNKGLNEYVEAANHLLHSHVDQAGHYDLSYLSSDAQRLDETIPRSGT